MTDTPKLEDLWERKDFRGLCRALQRLGYGQTSIQPLINLDIQGLSRIKKYLSHLERWSRGKVLICPYCGKEKVCALLRGPVEKGWDCLNCHSSWETWGKAQKRKIFLKVFQRISASTLSTRLE